MHNSNQHHSFINSQVAELLSNLAISRRSTLSGSTVKCCSGLQQNFYFATANFDDFLNLADTLAIRSMAWESGKSTAGHPFTWSDSWHRHWWWDEFSVNIQVPTFLPKNWLTNCRAGVFELSAICWPSTFHDAWWPLHDLAHSDWLTCFSISKLTRDFVEEPLINNSSSTVPSDLY